MPLSHHTSRFAIARFFEYGHLRPELQAVSKKCGDLACEMLDLSAAKDHPEPQELAAGLRHLLEAKDAFVRAMLPKPVEPSKPS